MLDVWVREAPLAMAFEKYAVGDIYNPLHEGNVASKCFLVGTT